MINFKTNISEKEKNEIDSILNEISDVFSDFYVTKENLRLFIKENSELLYDSLNKGDKIAYSDKGIIFITGWSDKANRIYIKVLSEDLNEIEQLLQVVLWNIKCDLWIKIKKNNPANQVFQKHGFKFFGSRGVEILLHKDKVK